MWQKLESWRKKDESTRRLAALGVSAAITLIIVGVWATVFFRDTAKDIIAAPQAAKNINYDKGPIAAFSESTSRAWQSIVEQFESIKKTVEKTTENLEKMAPQNATSTSENVI